MSIDQPKRGSVMKRCDCGDHNRNVAELTLRAILQIGGVSVVGASLVQMFGSTKVLAQGMVTPRGSADQVIFIAMRGGPSHMDTFSVKEGSWTPDDWDVQPRGDTRLSNL